jgi:hypothetical protein
MGSVVVGVAGYRDDGVRCIGRLVVLRGLIIEVPSGGDASGVGLRTICWFPLTAL